MLWQDILEFEYDLNGQMLSEQNSAGVYRHSYDDNGNLSSTALPDGQSLSYLYYGSGHLQQMNWRERGKQTVLAEYSRDRLHRETNRLSGGLDQRTEYDSSGRITAQIARLANSTRVTAATIDKRYTWDKHNNLTERSVSYGQADSPLTQGHWQYETYRYDPLGQLTRRLNGFSEELFLYDEAVNLLGHQRQVAFNNQVTTSEEYDYTYDGFGRMAQRRVRDSAVCQHYHYDAEHRITAVTFEHDPQGNQRAEYDYDILGRRTGKRVWQSAQAQRLKQSPENRAPEETVQFCWNGLRLAAEKSSKSAHLTLHYVYNSGSYNPLARIESFDHPEKQTTDISYYHVALNGLPEELTDSQGRIIWHGDYSLWGKLKREQHPVAGFRGQQNLRFQGQYFDRETGLHYNTFRYYAPDTGRFTQQDPIGLLGGLNLYQYAPNPVGWVDPWGWACSPNSSKLAKPGEDLYVGTYNQVRNANIKNGLNSTHTPHHAIQNAASPTTHGRGITINLKKDLHDLTWTFKKPMVKGLSHREYLARDIVDLRKILRDAGYSRDVINRQLSELIKQNKAVWKALEV
ncbi:Cell wall-associated polypeptide CWBP200 [Morganella morganii]|uniref:RHS repeat-associated core domain-containing protein n=1 Tax=Morganella morganii TaxID=582 RepID=UPI000D95CD6D|nr:RHS repeat-associated core domain-containing protein [Morganella morganii]SPX93176.1 Cell wall-associated polypeptide CWBP200 [Morganella morganii]